MKVTIDCTMGEESLLSILKKKLKDIANNPECLTIEGDAIWLTCSKDSDTVIRITNNEMYITRPG
jgi:hypothetical protein